MVCMSVICATGRPVLTCPTVQIFSNPNNSPLYNSTVIASAADDGGNDLTANIQCASQLLLNRGAEQDMQHWVITTDYPSSAVTSWPSSAPPHSGNKFWIGNVFPWPGDVAPQTGMRTHMHQDINISTWASTIDTTGQQFGFGGWFSGFFEIERSTHDQCQVIVSCHQTVSSSALHTVTSVDLPKDKVPLVWEEYSGTINCTAPSRLLRFAIECELRGGTVTNGMFDDLYVVSLSEPQNGMHELVEDVNQVRCAVSDSSGNRNECYISRSYSGML